MAVTAMTLAAEFSEHKRTDEYVRQLAVTDPLTGLANYRRLLDALDSEIKRYDRSGRPFAVVLLDMDGLKVINDTYGHLVGTEAICRLANILRIHCRAMDTAARYGGDEFVLILPETESPDALRVANRIAERLSTDGDDPPVTVSTGTAVYPHDGKTIDELLAAADHVLYLKKGSSKKKLHQPTCRSLRSHFVVRRLSSPARTANAKEKIAELGLRSRPVRTSLDSHVRELS